MTLTRNPFYHLAVLICPIRLSCSTFLCLSFVGGFAVIYVSREGWWKLNIKDRRFSACVTQPPPFPYIHVMIIDYFIIAHSIHFSPQSPWEPVLRLLAERSPFRKKADWLPNADDGDVEKRQEEEIQKSRHWTLSLDGWTDASKNSIYAVLLINQNTQHYLGNLELSEKRHTADNIGPALIQLLGEKIQSVAAIVTDNPNVMKKVRGDLCIKHSRIVNMGCVLHSINLICRDLVTSPLLKADAQYVNMLVVYFSNSEFWRQAIIKYGENHNVQRFLTKYIETRWYSYVYHMCVQQCEKLWGWFKECIERARTSNECPSIRQTLLVLLNRVFLSVCVFKCRCWSQLPIQLLYWNDIMQIWVMY